MFLQQSWKKVSSTKLWGLVSYTALAKKVCLCAKRGQKYIISFTSQRYRYECRLFVRRHFILATSCSNTIAFVNAFWYAHCTIKSFKQIKKYEQKIGQFVNDVACILPYKIHNEMRKLKFITLHTTSQEERKYGVGKRWVIGMILLFLFYELISICMCVVNCESKKNHCY